MQLRPVEEQLYVQDTLHKSCLLQCISISISSTNNIYLYRTYIQYIYCTYLCQMLLYGQYFNGQKEGLCFESSLLKKSKRTLHE